MAADHTDNQSDASDRKATAERAGRALDDGRSVLLVGPAGIGKTTLVGTIIARRDAVVARCLECFTGLAYRPLSHAVGTSLSGPPDEVVTELAGGLDDRLLVVEDLHWADSPTLSALAVLAARRPVLVTSRNQRAGLAASSLDTIVVDPLARPRALALARRLHPNLSPVDRAALVTAAAGNPLLIEHLVGAGGVSPTFEAAAEGRLRRLPDDVLDGLGRLALHGRPAEPGMIGALDPDACDHVVAHGDDGRLWFVHDRFATAVIDLLGEQRLAELRARLALDSDPADAARHYLALGDLADAARCAIAGAEVADPPERADLLALAVDASGTDAPHDLLLRTAEAMISSHRPTDAHRAASMVEAAADDDETLAAAGLYRAQAAWLDGDQAGAAATVDASLDRVGGTGTRIEAELVVERASIAARVRMGDPSTVELADAAVVAADRWGRHRAKALNAAGLARARTGRPGWEECFREAAEAARSSRDVEEECAAQFFLISAYMRYGALPKATEIGLAMFERTRALGLRRWHHHFVATRALHLAATDRLTDDMFDACRRLLIDEPLFRNRIQIELPLAVTLAERDQIDAASALIDEGLRMARNDEDRAALACARCEVALAARDPDLMARALDELDPHADGYYWFNPLAESSVIHLSVAMPGWRALPTFRIVPASMFDPVRIERAAYELQVEHGVYGAIDKMNEAADAWERAGLFRFARRARCATVEIAHTAGDAELTTRLLDGLDRSEWPESATTRRLVELRRQVDRARVERLLTRREIEVLTHVAAGLTSAQIAARLGITTATVDSHISDAMQRLGCRTRRQAATMVVA